MLNLATLFDDAVGVAMLIVCIAGLCGNVAAIIVFSKPYRLQKNFYTFMFYLAIFDLMYTIVAIFVFIPPQLSNYYKHNGPWHYVVPWAIPIGQVSMTGSVYFTMVITLERYLTVCHPFYMFSRNWSSRPIVIGIIIFAIAYNIPKFLETSTVYELCCFNQTYTEDVRTMTYSSEACEVHYQMMQKNIGTDINTNHTIVEDDIVEDETISFYKYTIQPSEMRLNSLYVQVYAVYLNFFVNGVGPFALLIILNISILRELQKTELVLSPTRQQQSNDKRDPNETFNARYLPKDITH